MGRGEYDSVNRRALLATVGSSIGTVSGCGAWSSEDTSRQTPQFVSPPPCPEVPESLTESTIQQFVPRFERAYRTRVLLQEHDRIVSPVEFIGLRNSPPVDTVGPGFSVRLVYRLTYRQLSDGPTPVADHVDTSTSTIEYYIKKT